MKKKKKLLCATERKRRKWRDHTHRFYFLTFNIDFFKIFCARCFEKLLYSFCLSSHISRIYELMDKHEAFAKNGIY